MKNILVFLSLFLFSASALAEFPPPSGSGYFWSSRNGCVRPASLTGCRLPTRLVPPPLRGSSSGYMCACANATGVPNASCGIKSNPGRLACECSAGFNQRNGGCSSGATQDPDKNPGDSNNGCSNSPSTNNPIIIGTGNKWLKEVDYNNSLSFYRTYHSSRVGTNVDIGKGWITNYAQLITTQFNNTEARVRRPNGSIFTFNIQAGAWRSDPDITDRLEELKNTSNIRTGWRYTLSSNGDVETYNVTGKLLSIRSLSGLTLNFTYSVQGTPANIAPFADLLLSVTNSLGQSLQFTYDSYARIKTLTNPSGDVYSYTYDAIGNLISVAYPDGKLKQYLYGEAAFVSATPEPGVDNTSLLTGIIDELGVRYATYNYDTKGRAYAETLPQSADATNLTYNLDSNGNPASTSVTDANGNTRTFSFTTILGVVKSTGNNQPAGSGCPASSANISYDANGNMISRTDFNGNQTTYVYDLARNLETSRTEGLDATGSATSVTRTIATQLHPQWKLPQQITVHTGTTSTGIPIKRTKYTYNAQGHATSITEEDPVLVQSRTTAISYIYSTAVPGLILQKVVNGPRSDVNDIVTYNYYPHDASCTASSNGSSAINLGCRGQLLSITDALGKVTQFSRYNHYGQLEENVDPNNVATTYTYDKRQRLLSYNKTSESMTLSYDATGQITQLTLPDTSTLNFTYDDAHRLTDIQDTLGNKVHYSLDPMGNRVQEDYTDLQGNLAKIISRSYDALNRLQALIGQD